jgi:transposase
MSKTVRISTYRPALANCHKLVLLKEPQAKYKIELQKLVSAQLYQPKAVKKFADKSITDSIDLSARLSQVCAKQASAIVRSIQEKVRLAQKAHNKQKYQQEILAKWNTQSLLVDVKSVNIELDSRFVDIQPNKTGKISTHWIKITSFPKGSYLIPFTPTRHMIKLMSAGYQLQTNHIRVNSDGSLGIYFEKQTSLRTTGAVIGVDMGRNKIISCSNGSTETTHCTGTCTKKILDKIARRKQGSAGHAKARSELRNQINYSIKHDVPWNQISQLVIEDLSDIKQGNKWGRRHQFWTVGYAQSRIQLTCEENGVRLTRVCAAYTSQTCGQCGFKHKKNRSGERFKCLSCEHEADADINAAVNICNRGAYSPSAIKI